MPFILTLIVGAAAGMIAVHYMKLNTNILVSIAIGVLGAILGSFGLRALVVLMLGASSVVSLFVGALIGAVAVIWFYRTYFDPK